MTNTNKECEWELMPEGYYVPKMVYTTDPREIELLEKPIGRWGKMWQDWIEAEHPFETTIFIVHCKWQIIPREIDIEAEARLDELDKIYRKTHPRPTEFNETVIWEKARLMSIEKQVMEEIVFQVRAIED